MAIDWSFRLPTRAKHVSWAAVTTSEQGRIWRLVSVRWRKAREREDQQRATREAWQRLVEQPKLEQRIRSALVLGNSSTGK